jgi:hypothetical protein
MEINWKDGTTTKVVDRKIVTYEKELEYIKYNSHKTLPAMLKGFAKQRNTTPLSKINQDVYKEALRVVRLYQESQQTDMNHQRFKGVSKSTTLSGAGISCRLHNVLCYNKERFFGADMEDVSWNSFLDKTLVSDLSKIDLIKFKRTEGVGKKTVQELKDLCDCAGVQLK